MRIEIAEVQAAVRPYAGLGWSGHDCGGSRPAIAAITGKTGARTRRDEAIGPHLAIPVVGAVAEIDHAITADTDAEGNVELRGCGGPAVAAEAARARARHRGEDPLGIDPPDAVVGVVGEIDTPVRRDRDAIRGSDLRRRGGSPVAAEPRHPGPGGGGDDSIGPDAADAKVVLVRDVEGAIGRQRDAIRLLELGRRRRTAIPAVPGGTRPGHRREAAVRFDAPNAMVEKVGEIETAIRRDRNHHRIVHLRGDCRPAIAAEPGDARARDGRDDPTQIHFANAMVETVGDIQRAVRTEGGHMGKL